MISSGANATGTTIYIANLMIISSDGTLHTQTMQRPRNNSPPSRQIPRFDNIDVSTSSVQPQAAIAGDKLAPLKFPISTQRLFTPTWPTPTRCSVSCAQYGTWNLRSTFYFASVYSLTHPVQPHQRPKIPLPALLNPYLLPTLHKTPQALVPVLRRPRSSSLPPAQRASDRVRVRPRLQLHHGY